MNLYPHSWRTVPFDGVHVTKGEHYCERCHFLSRIAGVTCVAHPEYPRPILPIKPVLAGDIIEAPSGINREIGSWSVHEAYELRNGGYSLRVRPLGNPRAIDWSLYVAPAEPELKVLARGVAAVDPHPRSLLP